MTRIKFDIPYVIFDSSNGQVEVISVFAEQVGDVIEILNCKITFKFTLDNVIYEFKGCKVPEGSPSQHGFNSETQDQENFWLNSSHDEQCMPLFRAMDINRSNYLSANAKATANDFFEITLGTETCSQNIICNGPLRAGKNFQVRFRLRTKKLYRDLLTNKIKMDNEVPFVLIVSIIASSIVSVFFVGLWISYRRTMRMR